MHRFQEALSLFSLPPMATAVFVRLFLMCFPPVFVKKEVLHCGAPLDIVARELRSGYLTTTFVALPSRTTT